MKTGTNHNQTPAGRHRRPAPARANAWFTAIRIAAIWLAAVLACTAAAGRAVAGEEPARIAVRLVDSAGTLVSDLEELQPVVRTVFDAEGSKTMPVGERATLWVRNANVDGKFAFEQFYEGKYINRRAEVEIPIADLGVGEHVINPGNHRFSLGPDGKLASNDPEISIEKGTVSLLVHKVDVLCVDGARSGPPEYRLIGADVGLLELKADAAIDPANLPAPASLPTMLSHARKFYPLAVYLPSNTVGQGYVLYPSWQAFHLPADGTVRLSAANAPRVPGIEAEASRIVIPYRVFHGKLTSTTGLQGGVGAVPLRKDMEFSPTLEPLMFRAGLGKPDDAFFLPVDNDFSKNPNKFFLADNTAADPKAVRLLALEWAHPVLTRGQSVTVALRFLDTPGMQTVKQPAARMSYSIYSPSSPDERWWSDLGPVTWSNGSLTFTVPDVPYNFSVFRATVLEGDAASTAAKDTDSPLSGEFEACIIEKGQAGTASFISNKARNAFVIGEEIRLQVALRSKDPRPAGERRIVLKYSDGLSQEFPFQDPGTKWHSKAFSLPAEVTRALPPGAYELAVAGLPPNVVPFPFRFDLASDQKTSAYIITKPSKYTRQMNDLVTSHTGDARIPAVNLDRTVASLAELGYNRLDLMTYITNHHMRPHSWREVLAGGDDRLMAAETVYVPSPRDQIINACARNRIDFSEVFLSYGDFHLPRYMDGYIEASKRWVKREAAAMRHSPAFTGMMLYDEMYDMAAVGLTKEHQKLWPAIRDEKATKAIGKTPGKITDAMSRYVSRPRNQRDPQALQDFLSFGRWERHGWGDYNTQIANAAREVAPWTRYGTYHRTWMTPGAATGLINGYPPDVFENLDIVSHVHYADNSTGWVHSSMLASALRFGPRRPVFVNIPLLHEVRGRWNGEYERHMAFAMLMQGADGMSFWGLGAAFQNKPNPEMMAGKETTEHLNREILAPFGEIVSRTDPGYNGVGIVYTENQLLLGDYKQIGVSNQAEELWLACWRLGYGAQFLYEDAFDQSVSRFKLIFVPGIRFDGELEPKIVQRLQEAMKAGTKVVVERGSELDIPGVVKLDDLTLTDFYLRNYFPTWLDDELNKIFEKTQTATDILRVKLPELGIEPAGRGPFKVGPNWRHSGDINYLIMANFDDPDYGHTVKQIMAKPVRMPLLILASRGKAAYDLLAQKPLAISPPPDTPAKAPSVGPPVGGGPEVAVELDMTRVQGALAAFLPEPVGKLQLTIETVPDNSRLRLAADLIGASGNRINGVFPARVRLLDDKGQVLEEFFRVLGGDLRFDMNLPAAQTAPAYAIEVRENISGQTAKAAVNGPAYTGAAVVFTDESVPFVPYPNEVKKFMANTKQATLIVSESIPGLADVAKQLVESLKARGITATIRNEMDAYRFPAGDKELRDQYEDGFHSWRAAEVIQPATAVDAPAIIMAGKSGSYLLEGLVTNGFITEVPTGGPGIRTRTSIQVAPDGLHWKYDTLCLIANDVSGMRQVVDTLLKGVPDVGAGFPSLRATAAVAGNRPPYTQKSQHPSAGPTDAAPAVSFLGNNEYVTDMKFDKAGNSYIMTWGHGNNIYSLDPAGKLRFTRQLPEACASRLDVFDDRVLVFTSAGSRLYQMTLDGQPIMQARLTMDPGPIGDEEYALSYVDYAWIPSKRAVLENVGTMRLFDENGTTLVQWAGEQYADKDVADKIMERQPRGFVFSPDGSKVAQLETSFYFTQWDYMDVIVYDTHLVMRDLNGTLLAEYKNIANENGYGSNAPTARVYWLPGMPGPAVVVKGEKWQFDESLKLLFTHVYDPGVFQFDGEKRLVRDGDSLRYLDGEKPEIARMGPFPIMPSVASLSPDAQKIALLDEYGLLGVYEAQTGKRLIELTVSQLGHVLRFTPDSASLMLGGLRGLVACFDMQGKPVWQTPLGQFNAALEHPALYDPSFRDVTNMLWPEGHDQPGELEAMVKLGPDRLVNGTCETDGGWTGEKVAYQPEGRSSARSLKVGDSTVVQDVQKYLGNEVTWVLEFFYKAAPGSTAAASDAPKLTVGVMVESKYPDSFARTLTGTADWQFARIAAKSGMQCKAMRIGFRAAGGEVLVDSASFRQIRFPSINHLQYEALHEIEPVVLTNPLFSENYDPIGNLRMEGPGQVTVPPYGAGGKPLVEPAFLQNGRLNEITSYWYEMPPKAPWESTSFPISLALREPRWISMIALYFNCYDEANVTPHFDVYVTDLESRKEVLVASVRNNKEIFRLVKFPPIKSSLVRLELVNSIRRLRTITEVELYGPLSGKEMATGFAEPDGQNTWMGSFARVDKRPKTLAAEYAAPIVKPLENDLSWSAPSAQILVSEGKFYVSRLLGHNDLYELAEPTVVKSRARTGGIGFAPYVTIYGGLLLKCGNDGKLYCIDAESGRELWSAKLAERLRCCPVAIAEDLFVANQQGAFYKLDLANGSMMMEVELPGGVYGSLATDGRQIIAITDDGLVQSIDPATGNVLWKTPVAPYSESTPAVDANVVYLADQQGKAFALNASNGTPVWTAALGQEFTRCPVVTDKYVIFGCRDGKLAVLNRADGKEVRSIQTSSRFSYEPVAFGEQILYFDNDKAMLLNVPDGATRPLQAYYPKARAKGNDPQEFELKDVALDDDPLTPISYYKGYLFFVPRHLNSTHVIQEMNTVWNPAGGKFFVLPPRAK